MADHHILETPPLPPSPPDPPDPLETHTDMNTLKESTKDSFKAVLINKENSLNGLYLENDKWKAPMLPQDLGDAINLSEEDKERIYAPWKFSVIVKVFNKKLAHSYLKIKLTELWKPTEPLTLIDLGNDFYVAKFNNPDNMHKDLHEGPWFAIGKFLSVRRWEPNFVPEEDTQTHSVIWIRLPQLPTKFYDRNIFERIGNHLGTLLWIDTCTSAALRGRYARICNQVPLHEPIKKDVIVGTHKQRVVYEGEGVLCTGCGRLGNILTSYPISKIQPFSHIQDPNNCIPSTSKETVKVEEWQTVKFPKRKQSSRGV